MVTPEYHDPSRENVPQSNVPQSNVPQSNVPQSNVPQSNVAGEPRRYFVRTFGCQMNEHDSERLAGLFESEGMVPAGGAEDADVVIFNTCCIRENADNRLYGNLGQLRAMKQATTRVCRSPSAAAWPKKTGTRFWSGPRGSMPFLALTTSGTP